MRTIIILAALPLAACGSIASGNDSGARAQASGSGTTRSFAVADFTKIDLRGNDDVIVTVGGGFAVRAEGPSDELDKLEILKDGGTLKVGRVRQGGLNWGGARGRAVKVYVTMPSIAGAGVAGSGDLSIDKVAGGDFSGAVAGSGDLSIAAVKANAVDFSIAGSGNIAASGEAGKATASIAGSGNVDAKGLKATSATISVAGSGNVSLDVNGPAEVSLMGSGDVDVGANARCKTNKMGSGSVRCG